MNKRLYSWVEYNKKLDESQAGFRAGYSAIDNIFSLSSVVQKYLSRRGGRFYCLYVDFQKKPLIRLNMYISLKVSWKKEYIANSYGQLKLCTQTYKQLYAQLTVKQKRSRVISVLDEGT